MAFYQANGLYETQRRVCHISMTASTLIGHSNYSRNKVTV